VKLGYHAPLPPAATGVADYAQDLLEALRQVCAEEGGSVEVAARDADVHLCQLGNNLLHAPVQRVIEQAGWPGRKLVLLHDANLHHYYLGALGREGYLREFCGQYGEWYRGFAEQLWNERARSASDPRYFQYAMLAGIVRASDAVLVHNPEARRRVLAQTPGAKVEIVPHYYRQRSESEGWRVQRIRADLGLTSADTLFGVFGHLRESKRVPAVLRAFERARLRNPRLHLLIAGQPVSEQFARYLDARSTIAGVIRRGHLPEPEFWQMASAVDACINLRYPSCGESSGIAVRLMGLGKPVMLTAGETGFPPATYLPVDAGEAEEEMVCEWMLLLAVNRRLREDIGRNAAAHIRANHDLPAVARRVWGIARGVLSKEDP
jgi:glycosyltransferase involved in cell wall biosynthesis